MVRMKYALLVYLLTGIPDTPSILKMCHISISAMAKGKWQSVKRGAKNKRPIRAFGGVVPDVGNRFAKAKNLGFKRKFYSGTMYGRGFGDRLMHPRSKVGKFLKKTGLVSKAARVLGNIPELAFLKPASRAVAMIGYGRRGRRRRACSCKKTH
jgi:hypothetical protein